VFGVLYVKSGRLDLNQRPLGPEPEGGVFQPPQAQALTTPAANACTCACTNPAGRAHEPTSAGRADDDFAAALKMLAALPLSAAEKAEAVRRLLAGHDAKGKA